MATEFFRLEYDGPALRDGTMNALDFAHALIGVGEVCARANELLNGNRATVTLRIQAGAEPGSFPADLELYQKLTETLFQVIRPREILTYLGLAAATVYDHPLIWNLLDLWKATEGVPPKVLERRPDQGTSIIDINGENHEVNSTVLNFFGDPQIHLHLPKVVEPLEKPGVDVLRAVQGGSEVNRITKDQAGFFSGFRQVRDAMVRAGEENMAAEIITFHFRDGYKWRFAEPGLGIFTAHMRDSEFMGQIERGEISPLHGDTLHFRMRTTLTQDDEKDLLDREILKVYDITHAPRQSALL